MRRLIALLALFAVLTPASAWARALDKFAVYDVTLTNAVVVTNTTPGVSDYGLVTRVAGSVSIVGGGTNNAAAASTTAISSMPGIVFDTPQSYTAGRGVYLGVASDGSTWVKVPELGKVIYRSKSASAANQDATNVSAAATIVYAGSCSNSHASNDAWVHLYNVASPTSASTPVKSLYLPPKGGNRYPTGVDGDAYSTRFSLRMVGTDADNSTTAVATNQVICNWTLSN